MPEPRKPWEEYAEQPGAKPWEEYAPKAPALQPEQFNVGSALGSFLKGAIVNTAKGIYETGKRIAEGPKSPDEYALTALGPAGGVAKDMFNAQVETGRKGVEAWKRGDTKAAIGYGLNAAVPIIGPMFSQAAERVSTGDPGTIAEVAGELVGQAALPAVAKLAPKNIRLAPGRRNPVLGEAVAFADERGIPVDAATRSGRTSVGYAQKLAGSTPLGNLVQDVARTNQKGQLRRVAGELMDETSPGSVTPEAAGRELQGSLSKRSSEYGETAIDAYDTLRKIEEMPDSRRTVQTGTRVQKGYDTLDEHVADKTVPQTETMAFPVDVRPLKKMAAPLIDRLNQLYKSADPEAAKKIAQQEKMLGSIMEGPDFKPASIAESDVGNLKSYLRNQPELNEARLRHTEVLDALQENVNRAVSEGGPSALKALEDGRKNWARKMEFEEFTKTLREEPVQTFNKAVWRNDTGIGWLRQADHLSPEVMPKVGRAWLENVIDTATASGELSREAGMLKQWESMGPQTKKILFREAAHIKNIDNFFRLAKAMADTPNPSGSGLIGTYAGSVASLFVDPVSAIGANLGAGGLSKILHSPKGARLLVEGFKIPADTAAGQAHAARLAAIAGINQQEKKQ